VRASPTSVYHPQVPLTPAERCAEAIIAGLQAAGIDLVASLPDKWLTPLAERIDARPAFTHVRLASEDDGVGVCAGAFVGGRRAALICQNAGLLLAANALAGMALHHQTPFLALAAHRGAYDDSFFYQVYKGQTVEGVLHALEVPFYVVDDESQLGLVERAAKQAYLARRPVVLLLRRQALLG
jgi:sulfopyruvate decarboxylase subunit alpha